MTVCFRCGRSPDQIQEYVDYAAAEGTSPEVEARSDGTYNRDTDHFACTDCYIKLGMPTAPGPGWKAP